MQIKEHNVSAQLKEAVRDLYDDYAQAVDAEQLDRWIGFFSDDAVYRVIARESHSLGLPHATIYCEGIGMIRDRANMLQKVAVFEPRVLRHFITGVRIQSASADCIVASANFLIIESLFDAEPVLLMVGQYQDEIISREGDLCFRKRDAIYDQYRVRTTLVMPV
jgi:anthranilate 1,2-dioxygenase small subunit